MKQGGITSSVFQNYPNQNILRTFLDFMYTEVCKSSRSAIAIAKHVNSTGLLERAKSSLRQSTRSRLHTVPNPPCVSRANSQKWGGPWPLRCQLRCRMYAFPGFVGISRTGRTGAHFCWFCRSRKIQVLVHTHPRAGSAAATVLLVFCHLARLMQRGFGILCKRVPVGFRSETSCLWHSQVLCCNCENIKAAP